MQLAGRLAEPRDREDGRHLAPGDLLASPGQDAIEQDIQFQQPPKPHGEPDVANAAKPFEMDILELDQDRLIVIRLGSKSRKNTPSFVTWGSVRLSRIPRVTEP
jgi:hypothetical protein